MSDRIEQLRQQATEDILGVKILDHRQFAELIVNECCRRLSKENIRHGDYGYNKYGLYQALREHFGLKNENLPF